MNAVIPRILIAIIIACLPANLRAEEIIINAVGDIMLAGQWAPLLKKNGYDFPFGGVAKELAGGDINLANLESPIATSGSEFTTKKFRFRAEPALADALHRAGFNLVNLANNHSMDFGWDALEETQRHLAASGIDWIGAGENLNAARKPSLHTIKGKKLAFLGYSLTQPTEFFAGKNSPGTAPGYEKLVEADIRRAKQQADFVIVSFHWGTEASPTVLPGQRNTAHRAIEAGADFIIGHHPHLLQGIELYEKGIIFYSLGNFTFASKSNTADVSAIIRLRLDDDRRTAEIIPIDVLNRRVGFQPQLLKAAEGDAVIEKLNELSKTFGTEIKKNGDRFVISF